MFASSDAAPVLCPVMSGREAGTKTVSLESLAACVTYMTHSPNPA